MTTQVEKKAIIPQQPRWHGRIAARVISVGLKSLAASWRIETDPTFAQSLDNPVIFAIWHNRLAVVMEYWGQVRKRQPAMRLAALVSASRDGGLLSCTLQHFGVEPVRGSSSRRGAQALRESISMIGNGYSVAITPDGPRGPKYSVHPGVISLAQLTGRPILPAGASINHRIDLRSWDRFQVPLPFSRCELRLGKPITIKRDATPEEREAKRLDLERMLRELNPD